MEADLFGAPMPRTRTMSDVRSWLDTHTDHLREIADHHDLDLGAVEVIAILVLTGSSDQEILETMHEQRISMDGQHDPLRGAPQAIFEVRHLAAA
jgi:hypothetical protein